MEENPNKWQGSIAVDTQNSQGEIKLNHLIHDLQKFTFQEGNEVCKHERIQEAQVLLEQEKHQAEQTLAKQEIQLNDFIRILTNMGRLPSK